MSAAAREPVGTCQSCVPLGADWGLIGGYGLGLGGSGKRQVFCSDPNCQVTVTVLSLVAREGAAMKVRDSPGSTSWTGGLSRYRLSCAETRTRSACASPTFSRMYLSFLKLRNDHRTPWGGRELIGPLREQADSVSDLLGVVFGEGGCRSSCGRLLASCAACSDVHDDRGDDPAGRGGASDQGDQLRCVHIRMVAAARCIGMTVRLTNPAVARPEGCERG